MDQATWNWQKYFDSKTLADGIKDEKEGLVSDYQEDARYGVVTAQTRSFEVTFRPPASYADCRDMRPWNVRPEPTYDNDTATVPTAAITGDREEPEKGR